MTQEIDPRISRPSYIIERREIQSARFPVRPSRIAFLALSTTFAISGAVPSSDRPFGEQQLCRLV